MNKQRLGELHHIIVNAVVEKDGKILVSRRSFEEPHEPGKWTIPGGKTEITEGNIWNILEVTCIREIKEETGIDIYNNDIKLLTNNTFIHSSNKHAIALIFLCHWKSGNPQALEDTIDVKWISLEELNTLEFAPNVKNYIQKGFNHLSLKK